MVTSVETLSCGLRRLELKDRSFQRGKLNVLSISAAGAEASDIRVPPSVKAQHTQREIFDAWRSLSVCQDTHTSLLSKFSCMENKTSEAHLHTHTHTHQRVFGY